MITPNLPAPFYTHSSIYHQERNLVIPLYLISYVNLTNEYEICGGRYICPQETCIPLETRSVA